MRQLFGIGLVVLAIPVGGMRAQSTLPVLRRVTIPSLDTIGPEKARGAVAISSAGVIAFTGAFDSANRAVTIIDTTGRILARVGPQGQGPGELGGLLQLAFAGTELVAIDIGSRKMSRFGFDGAYRGAVTMPTAMGLAGVTRDSIDMVRWPDGKAVSPMLDFVRVSPVSASGRLLMSGQTPVLRELGQEGLQKGNILASVLYISDGASVVAVNVGSYRLMGFEADGRVSFDMRGARVSTPPGETPLYPNGGVQRDGMQRIWALGTNQATGRTFADLYLKGRFLGRLDLPCKGEATVTGPFMAIRCREPESADRDVSLRVYRIDERR
jgi:hypothetical protein